MNYEDALKRLERLRELIDKYMPLQNQSAPDVQDLLRQIYEAYGEVEEIIERIEGRGSVTVPPLRGGMQPATYSNFIEAGFLSGFNAHAHQGYAQLLKIIGKVRRIAADPALIHDEVSIAALVRTLNRFRECCQYVREPPSLERDVQDIVWIMLRSQLDRVDREDTLPKFGGKAYKPDFGVPELGTLVEVKFIGEKNDIGTIQEGILADIPGYLADHTRYKSVVVLVYDAAHKLRDPRKFIEDLRTVDGIIEVLVIPGIG